MACSPLLRWNELALLPAALAVLLFTGGYAHGCRSPCLVCSALPCPRKEAQPQPSVQQCSRNISALAGLVTGVSEVQDSLSGQAKKKSIPPPEVSSLVPSSPGLHFQLHQERERDVPGKDPEHFVSPRDADKTGGLQNEKGALSFPY